MKEDFKRFKDYYSLSSKLMKDMSRDDLEIVRG
jgi:hypothetical protein